MADESVDTDLPLDDLRVVGLCPFDPESSPLTDDEVKALATPLGKSTVKRLSRFSHRARRQQSLRARLCAQTLLSSFGQVTFEEQPPESPKALVADNCVYTSLAHTDALVGAALSSAQPEAPLGHLFLDCEVMRPKTTTQLTRLLSFVAEGEFLPGFNRFASLHSEEETLHYFYALWGAYECSVKANQRYGLSMTERFVPRIEETKDGFSLFAWDRETKKALTVYASTLTVNDTPLVVCLLDTVPVAQDAALVTAPSVRVVPSPF